MNMAIDGVMAAVNRVLQQSASFRAIMSKAPEDRTEELEFFCHTQTFARYDAAVVAFDDATYRAHTLRRSCPDRHQQASTAIARIASMRAENDGMRLRQRGICAKALSSQLQRLTPSPPPSVLLPSVTTDEAPTAPKVNK